MESLRTMAIKAAANQSELIQRFGRIQSLEIDPSSKSLFASILLKGEPEPIQFKGQYQVESEGEIPNIRLLDMHISKEWIHEIVQLKLKSPQGISFALPKGLGSLLKYVL